MDAAAEGRLERRIAEIIRRNGPIGLDCYWNLALFDRHDGYYTSREPFGSGGDFVTAPDVSQMFGELIGAWLVAAWRAFGRPAPFVLAEVGPGRGTLMADVLRTVRRIDEGFPRAMRVSLVETSPRLARLQADALAAFDLPLRHVGRVEDLPAGPLFLLANELFDAVAIRQFAATAEGWRERQVTVKPGGGFGFTPAPLPMPPRLIGHPLAAMPRPPPGAILEVSPEREAIAGAIADRLARDGGAALMIDYGHRESGFGDTLQAVEGHAFADPLAAPGRRDITSHVDFARLSAGFAARGLAVAPVAEQGEFLLRLGLLERAAALARGRPQAEEEAIGAAVRRLAGSGDGEMGRLFKVLGVASRPLPLPPFPSKADD